MNMGREKQILRGNDGEKGKGYTGLGVAFALLGVGQAEAGEFITFSKAVWKRAISWGVPTVMRT